MSRAAAALLVASLAAAAPSSAGGQLSPPRGPQWRSPDWRLGGTWVQQSRFLEDGNGVTVHGRTTLAVEGGPSWVLFDSDLLHLRLRGGLQLRVAAPAVEIRERTDGTGPARRAGRAVLADLSARIEQDGGGILQLYGAAGTTWLRGPADVAPFRFDHVDGFHQAAELGAALRVAPRPVFITGAIGVFSYGSDTGDAGAGRVQRGAIGRAMLGARYGR